MKLRLSLATSLRVSPYQPDKWPNLVIDGSSTKGVGFVLFQWIKEGDPSKGATVVQAASSLLPPNLGFSPIDGEMAALQFALKAAHYYLLHCPRLRLFSDCSG